MSPTLLIVLKALDLIAMGVQIHAQAKPAFDKLREDLRRFAAEGRDPTPEEWAALDAETNRLLADLNP